MQKQRTMLLLLVSIICFSLYGQNTPYLAARSKAIDAIEKLQLPLQDNEALLQEEMARRSPDTAPRFAQKIEVDVSPTTHGNWSYRNGMAIWHLRVPSPGAQSLNFGFDQYEMPPGGQLLIFDPDQNEVRGPFTPSDNEEHEQLWTPVIPGDDIILEVSVPLDQQQNLKLHLKSINHDFLGFLDVAESLISGSCNLDVVCGADNGWGIVDGYRDIIQSVLSYGFQGDRFCTGFLVNNVREDCTAFFMTANHCGVDAGVAPSLVFYWNYQNSTCRQPGSPSSGGPGNGSLANFNTGSIFRASFASSDFVLLELDDPIPTSANAFFAGWDARSNLEQDTVITIHHPSNDEKRISFAFDGVYRGAWGQGATPIPQGNHLIVPSWDIGTTEGGSSGAPLFNSRKRVVGQLHGGQASCENDSYDSYGWFASSWEGGGTPDSRLKDWLDPDNTGIRVLDGRTNLQCNLFATATPAAQSVCAPDVATFDIQVSSAFNGAVSLSTVGLPGGLSIDFESDVVSPGATTQLTIGNTTGVSSGDYVFRLLATDGNNEVDQLMRLSVFADVPGDPAPFFPGNFATEQSTIITLDWTNEPFAEDYTVQLARNASFSNLSFSASGLTISEAALPDLATDTQYFWRVRGRNTCGQGAWSPTFQFTTAADFCGLQEANTDGVTIGPNAGTVTNSTINISQAGMIQEVKVTGFRTNHSFVGDLNATLTSPEGTTIQLFNRSDCPGVAILANFADDASLTSDDFEVDCTPGSEAAIQGTFQPVQALANFNDEIASGPWTLSIRDNEFLDGGDLQAWSLEICTNAPNATVELSGTTLKIWPNPTNGLVRVSFAEALSGEVDVAIYNVAGRFVRQEKLRAMAGSAELDLHDLPGGVYLLRVQHESSSAVVRMVKQ